MLHQPRGLPSNAVSFDFSDPTAPFIPSGFFNSQSYWPSPNGSQKDGRWRSRQKAEAQKEEKEADRRPANWQY